VPAEHLIAVPEALRDVGVLAEPASICARAVRHALVVGGRQPWAPSRALVLGAGAIGMLCTFLLRLEGLDVWTAALEPAGSEKAQLVEAAGARYVPSAGGLPPSADGFDVAIVAAASADLSLNVLRVLRRGGVAVLLGVDARDRDVSLPGPAVGLDMVLGNHALLGSVNANVVDWRAAMAGLDAARDRWPGVLERCVGLRTTLGDFGAAFAFGGVKATLTL
jgi:threonine dehydrogenase-like Zn-dependent dehydrogenase